jgi:hypothetical protein
VAGRRETGKTYGFARPGETGGAAAALINFKYIVILKNN